MEKKVGTPKKKLEEELRAAVRTAALLYDFWFQDPGTAAGVFRVVDKVVDHLTKALVLLGIPEEDVKRMIEEVTS